MQIKSNGYANVYLPRSQAEWLRLGRSLNTGDELDLKRRVVRDVGGWDRRDAPPIAVCDSPDGGRLAALRSTF